MSWETPGRKGSFWGQIVLPKVEIWRSKIEISMFAKVECSKNIFLWIRKVFCSHLAYPKQVFAHTSLSKLIKNRIYQNFDRKSPKMLVITAIFGSAGVGKRISFCAIFAIAYTHRPMPSCELRSVWRLSVLDMCTIYLPFASTVWLIQIPLGGNY